MEYNGKQTIIIQNRSARVSIVRISFHKGGGTRVMHGGIHGVYIKPLSRY